MDIEVGYAEYPVPRRIAGFVACLWSVRPRPESPATLVLPDGCTDLIWGPGGLFVAGPDSYVNPAIGYLGQTLVGLRFRPGAGGGAFGLPLSLVLNRRVPIDEIWASRLSTSRTRALHSAIRACEDAPSPQTALRSLVAVADLMAQDVQNHSVSIEAARRLSDPAQKVTRLADDLGFSQRQLQRVLLEDFGYGAKSMQRVLRFQRFLGLSTGLALAERAVAAGYSDQSHLSRECVSLSGLTPSALLNAV